MRLLVRHTTRYDYDDPAQRAVEILRVTPRGHDGQFIVGWRIDIDRDCVLHASVDPFGNQVHSFTAEGPFTSLSITAQGTVETSDTNGVLSGQVERFPPTLYLRETSLTEPDGPLKALAEAARASAGDQPLDLMHALMDGIRQRMRFETDMTDTGTTARAALELGHGVCQDFAHIFIAAARHLGVPTRYVGGYMLQPDETVTQEAGHAWAEALVEGLGWVGFDPANGISPTERYVRVVAGLDYLGAAPIRGIRVGGTEEKLSVSVEVSQTVR